MTLAEQRRNVRLAGLTDRELLDYVLDAKHGEDVTADEYVAFANMRSQTVLSRKQRSWLEDVARRITPIHASDVPRGREVPTPAVLQNLPKAPPRRR